MMKTCPTPHRTMRQALALATASCAVAFMLAPAGAQTGEKPTQKAAKAAAAKPTTKLTTKPVTKPVAKAPTAVPLPAANDEQIAAFAIAHLGHYPCELGETVSVAATPKFEGYVDVHHKKAVYTMKPVLSSTGALRLEDVKGRMLMLQIANKSMLMDVKLGQRIVDGCVHEKQQAAAARPPAQSLGIEAVKPAASSPG